MTQSIPTRRAAEIIGMDYEAFRTWMRRSPGRNAGMLPPFYSRNTPAEQLYSKRWTWARHDQGSVGIYALLRTLTERGLADEYIYKPNTYMLARPADFDGMNHAISTHEIWQYFSSEDNDDDWLLLYSDKDNSIWIFKQVDRPLFAGHVEALGRSGIVVNMGDIRRHVIRSMAMGRENKSGELEGTDNDSRGDQ